MSAGGELRVLRAADVEARPEDEAPWLIETLWGGGAVGVIGGAPKLGKSWLSLEMALAIASGQPCLGRFGVPAPGPVLVFAAEDAPAQVRDRLEGLCRARGADLESLDVHLIVEPCLRIDRADDVARLRNTVARIGPKLLVLDPYVRLQRVDENNSMEVSHVLGALRELSRSFAVAIALVHHARKSPADQAGQALRGSSDFHAWGDSNLYLMRRGEKLILSIEHRAAPSPAPLTLRLAGDEDAPCLEIQDEPPPPDASKSVTDRILEALDGGGPRRQEDLRALLRIRNQKLTEELRRLQRDSRVRRTAAGWQRISGA